MVLSCNKAESPSRTASAREANRCGICRSSRTSNSSGTRTAICVVCIPESIPTVRVDRPELDRPTVESLAALSRLRREPNQAAWMQTSHLAPRTTWRPIRTFHIGPHPNAISENVYAFRSPPFGNKSRLNSNTELTDVVRTGMTPFVAPGVRRAERSGKF
jgi:hypothetical protein